MRSRLREIIKQRGGRGVTRCTLFLTKKPLYVHTYTYTLHIMYKILGSEQLPHGARQVTQMSAVLC